mmetsp:Transcript_6619/g.27534  ORF Transcript_6619/g.27534 Transcript_6619/m.27534 type:complete len:325 (-) Transcript_6619:4314-5288(-)
MAGSGGDAVGELAGAYGLAREAGQDGARRSAARRQPLGQVATSEPRRKVAGIEGVAGTDGVEDVGGLGVVRDPLAVLDAERPTGADLDDQGRSGFQRLGNPGERAVQVVAAGDAARFQLVDEQMVAVRQPGQHLLLIPAFRRPAGVERDAVAAPGGLGQQLRIAAAQPGQQEGRGEQRDRGAARRHGGLQMLQHMRQGQLLQMAVGGEEIALAAAMHQADRDRRVTVADLEPRLHAGELFGQPAAEVVVADGRDQTGALADVAGGEGGIGGGAAGAQLAARHQLLGADLRPGVEGAEDEVDADISDDAQQGKGRRACRVHGRGL